jgi:hypothetical protein
VKGRNHLKNLYVSGNNNKMDIEKKKIWKM